MIKAAIGKDLDPCGDQQQSKIKRKSYPGVLTSREVSLLWVPKDGRVEPNPDKLNQTDRAEQGV